MKITLTITISKSNYSCDIQVNPEQKIRDALRIIEENLHVGIGNTQDIFYIKSKRTGRNINVENNFEQARIFDGDNLIIK